ncbi:MAG: hypothetical protein AAGA66_04880 [Bacteroidota bacterium]
METILTVLRTSVTVLTLMAGLVISFKSIMSLFYGSKYTEFDRILGKFFIVLVYLQFVLEVFMFFSSTYNYEESLEALEHIALITVATVSVQIGRMITLKSEDDLVKFRFRSIFYGMATFLLGLSFLI